jgi:hypothetical protein
MLSTLFFPTAHLVFIHYGIGIGRVSEIRSAFPSLKILTGTRDVIHRILPGEEVLVTSRFD